MPAAPRRATITRAWNGPVAVATRTIRTLCTGPNGTVVLRGATHIRPRERVRGHLHAPGTTPAESGRGRPIPVPAGRQLGAVEQRLPGERRPPVPRRGKPSRVRHAG